MRRFGWAISSLVLLPAMLFAQVITPPTMPGTPVSTSSVQPVGTRLPSVGTRLPSVGYPLPGYGDKPGKPGSKDTPFQGNFPKVDPDLVVAPFPTEAKQDDFWDKLLKRWDIAFAGDKQPIPPYTPGLARRNRERAKERERAEMLRRMRS
jgi:hypothetical protein